MGRQFRRGEARLLEALQPHFTATLARLHELALLHATIVSDPKHASRWMLLVDTEGTVAWASTGAQQALDLGAGASLPASLRTWLASARAGRRAAATVIVEGLTLRPHLVPAAYPELDALNLTPLPQHISPQMLRGLGLTRRQAEVLAAALRGRTTPEIADELALSPRTVEKHFEAIYARLGAGNRTEAIVTALVRLNFAPGVDASATESAKFAP